MIGYSEKKINTRTYGSLSPSDSSNVSHLTIWSRGFKVHGLCAAPGELLACGSHGELRAMDLRDLNVGGAR